MPKLWCMRFVLTFLTDAGRDCLQWPAPSGYWLFYIRCRLYKLSMECLMCGALFLHISIPMGCFMTTDYLYKKARIGKLPRTSSTWDLRTILKIISRGVPGVPTDSPYGVWVKHFTVKHLSPVWWSTFRFRFLIVSLIVRCENLI